MGLGHLIVCGVFLAGAVGFGVGVPTSQLLVDNRGLGTSPTIGYFSRCADTVQNTDCEDLTNDFYHCQKNDDLFAHTYGNLFWARSGLTGVDQTACQHMLAAEAFGVLAVIFSSSALISAYFYEQTHRHAGSTSALLSCMFGLIALAVFISIKPLGINAVQGDNNTFADYVKNNTFKLGYSAGLQIAGVICTFVGAILACVVGKVA